GFEISEHDIDRPGASRRKGLGLAPTTKVHPDAADRAETTRIGRSGDLAPHPRKAPGSGALASIATKANPCCFSCIRRIRMNRRRWGQPEAVHSAAPARSVPRLRGEPARAILRSRRLH